MKVIKELENFIEDILCNFEFEDSWIKKETESKSNGELINEKEYNSTFLCWDEEEELYVMYNAEETPVTILERYDYWIWFKTYKTEYCEYDNFYDADDQSWHYLPDRDNSYAENFIYIVCCSDNIDADYETKIKNALLEKLN